MQNVHTYLYVTHIYIVCVYTYVHTNIHSKFIYEFIYYSKFMYKFILLSEVVLKIRSN